MKNERICPFCQKKFEKGHGNQVYCSDDCRRYQKKATQNKLYNIYKEFRSGFLNNYKIFETILPEKGRIEKSFYEISILGFNSNCYYKTVKDKERIWHLIADYRFNISTNKKNIPLIEIVHE